MAGTTTVTQVFDVAMGLTDNISSAGLSDTSDTVDYKARALRIINNLQSELYPFSDSCTAATAGIRPIPTLLAAFTDVITDLDNYLAMTVLPYGLAALLLLDESPSTASFYQQRYEELKAAARSLPVAFEAIEDVYLGIENGEYSSW